MSSEVFGKTFLIDMYECEEGTADDMENMYRFLEHLVRELKMTPMSRPTVIHGPTTREGLEEYPEKAGLSAWQPLIESGIQVHAIEPSHFISIDVYTCGELDPEVVTKLCKQYFKYKDCETSFLLRGKKYAEYNKAHSLGKDVAGA